ncbi:bifunctional folylpolyglutamate synthase/dihydrofolate synthase [Candidatus Aerophobetes bacterium]|uniref:tetrahydrofolate synthase n=1 Tax=Aerophobetes bacterium TaxID=2030807 RepID=A0A523Y2C3_UNCAE|nr:MAG: bifunctional folylpolyglutamate synthase/dihydrofolate synthase [Candidatus Aerophobetes bacterium]
MWSYKEALRYVDSFVNYEREENFSYDGRFLNLKRMERLLGLIGNPHQQLKAIHIAGTKGKGSTAAIITSILTANGLKVGLYTSPHLIDPRERIRIGRKLISQEEFVYFLSQMRFQLENSSEQTSFTFFEIYTALAFLYFSHQRIDIAVLETGMGGRLDATNVVYPLLAVITQISFDHTRELGKDLASIAREKSGIIKEGVTVLTSPQDRAAMKVLEQAAREKKTELYKVGEDIQFKRRGSTSQTQTFYLETTKRTYPHLVLPLAGTHQLINAATAVGAIDLIEDRGIFTSSEAVRKGLKEVKWPGRIETLSTEPFFIVDCAHNGASAQALANYLKEKFPRKKIILILGILKNKDVESIARILCPLADKIILTRVDSPRALPPEEIEKAIVKFCGKKEILIEEKVENAILCAQDLACYDDLICTTGSVYLAGEILKYHRKKEKVCA